MRNDSGIQKVIFRWLTVFAGSAADHPPNLAPDILLICSCRRRMTPQPNFPSFSFRLPFPSPTPAQISHPSPIVDSIVRYYGKAIVDTPGKQSVGIGISVSDAYWHGDPDLNSMEPSPIPTTTEVMLSSRMEHYPLETQGILSICKRRICMNRCSFLASTAAFYPPPPAFSVEVR